MIKGVTVVHKGHYQYWGKANSNNANDNSAYHLLVFHSLDVAAVGWELLAPGKPMSNSLSKALGVDAAWLQRWFCFCLAIHDLGKFSSAFQSLVPSIAEQLLEVVPEYKYSERHDSLGFLVWKEYIAEKILAAPTGARKIAPWLKIVTGHHGTPPKERLRLQEFFSEQDKLAALEFTQTVQKILLVDGDFDYALNNVDADTLKACSWQLAGLAVIADWIGSDQELFSYQSVAETLTGYWQQKARFRAQKAIKNSPFGSVPAVQPFASIQQLFPFITVPTPLQEYACDVPLSNDPQLFVIEDVTGAGKTEAAMVLAHRMMANNQIAGLYVGLPTMATANGMYRRMAKAYRSLYASGLTPSLVLAHGARQLTSEFTDTVRLPLQVNDMDAYSQAEETASAFCNSWLADSNKKALLADVGVGTLDQVLLSVLPARHQSLRTLGLANKVLIVDEVHAYDAYMQRLLEVVLTLHAKQGGSAILLSATMPLATRQSLIKAYRQGLDKPADRAANIQYPLVTQVTPTSLEQSPVATRGSVKRTVAISSITAIEAAYKKVVDQAKAGRSVCWVRNTVDEAKEAYNWLMKESELEPDDVMLFHSRFAMIDRQNVENKVLDTFGKGEVGSGSSIRHGKVLIATQVVEQSLDLDFDAMITDLAPIDLLIQRAGRLQRHVRDAKGNLLPVGATEERSQPVLHIITPEPTANSGRSWLKSLLPKNEYIYPDLGKLWLTATVLLERKAFSMPEDARLIVEAVYADDALEKVPLELKKASYDAMGEEYSKRQISQHNALDLNEGYAIASAQDSGGWAPETHLPTRLQERETVDVVLAIVEGNQLKPYATENPACAEYSAEKLWALSQITLPIAAWKTALTETSEELLAMVEREKQRVSALKWKEVYVLLGAETRYSREEGWCT